MISPRRPRASVRLEQRDVHVTVGIGMVLEHRPAPACRSRSRRAGSSRGWSSAAPTAARRSRRSRRRTAAPGRASRLVVDRVRRERRPARHRLDRDVLRVARSGRSAAADGCSTPQSWQRQKRSSPSAPPVQKSRLLSVSLGRIRNGGSVVTCVESRPRGHSCFGFAGGFVAGARVRDRLDRGQQARGRAP